MKLPAIGSTTDVAQTFALEPGSAQRRDDALDHDPAVVVSPPLPSSGPTEGELQAEAAVDAAIAEGRAVVATRVACLTCDGVGWVSDPQAGLLGLVLCPACGGTPIS